MRNKQTKIVFLMQYIVLCAQLMGMEDESAQPLLASEEPYCDIESQQNVDYKLLYFKPLKESYLSLLPSEVMNEVFLFCDGTNDGLNDLIHHYEPDERVITKILITKMEALLKEKDVSILKLNCVNFVDLYKNEPLFYQKSKILLPLIDFEKMLYNEDCDRSLLESSFKSLCKNVKIKAAELQWPLGSENFQEGDGLPLATKVDTYLKFHQLYLNIIDLYLKTESDKIDKPRCWYGYVSLKNISSLLTMVGSFGLFFIATQFDYRYQLPCLIVGTCGGIGGIAWLSRTSQLCKKAAIPGYLQKQKDYKIMHKLIELYKKELNIDRQKLSTYRIS